MGYIGAGLTRFNTADELTVTGDAEFDGNLTVKGTHITLDSATVQTVDLGDNDKIRLGDSDDLQIYHDGGQSVIRDFGYGHLRIQAGDLRLENADGTATYLSADNGAALYAYHNGNVKLTTTATGVDVTGTALAHTVEIGDGSAGGTSEVMFSDNVSGRAKILYDHGASPNEEMGFEIAGTRYMTIENGGNVGIGASTIAANTKLHVKAGTNLNFEVENASSTLRLSGLNDARSANIPMQFASSQFEFITGNVGIGTSSPNEKVTINGSFRAASQDWQMQILNPDTAAANKGGGIAFGGSYTGAVQTYFSNILGAKENGTAGNLAGYLSFYTRSSGAGYTAERMRIDSSGFVGIGESSPQKTLHITKNDSDGMIVLDANGATTDHQICFSKNYGTGGTTGGNYWGIGVDGSENKLVFAYDPNAQASLAADAKVVLDSSGSVGIGTTSPISGVMLDIRPTSTTRIMNTRSFNTSSQYHHAFENSSGTLVGNILVTTSSTAYSTSSDYRLKENVVADWDATTRLKQLNPVRFNFIADADTTVDGFLAHEVQDIVPEAITGTKDGMRDEEYQVSAATGDIYTPAVEATYDEDGVELTAAIDEVIHSADVERPEELAEGQLWRETTAAVMGTRSVPDYQGIDQSKLVPLLCKTILELEARIAALETA